MTQDNMIEKAQVMYVNWAVSKFSDKLKGGRYVKIFTSYTHGKIFENPENDCIIRTLLSDYPVEKVVQVYKAFHVQFYNSSDAAKFVPPAWFDTFPQPLSVH